MGIGEIILIIAASAVVISVVVVSIVNKKKGKGCCDGNCAHCRGCSYSPKNNDKKKKI